MDEPVVHAVAAMAISAITGTAGWAVKSLFAQIIARLEKIEGTLQTAAEHRAQVMVQVVGVETRMKRVEGQLDKMGELPWQMHQ